MDLVLVASIIELNYSVQVSASSILKAVIEDKSTIFNFPTLLGLHYQFWNERLCHH